MRFMGSYRIPGRQSGPADATAGRWLSPGPAPAAAPARPRVDRVGRSPSGSRPRGPRGRRAARRRGGWRCRGRPGAGRGRAGRTDAARSPRRRGAVCVAPRGGGWYLDLAPFRYLSHFITPPSSRSASPRFFSLRALDRMRCTVTRRRRVQIDPAEGYLTSSGEMPMADRRKRARLSPGSAASTRSGPRTGRPAQIHGILDRIPGSGDGAAAGPA